MNKDWIGKYEDFQYGDNEQIELYDKIERFVGIKDNVVENRESYQRLLYLQKTDLNHWAQIDYQRMIKELLTANAVTTIQDDMRAYPTNGLDLRPRTPPKH